MGFSERKNVGSLLIAAFVADPAIVTAGGAGDGSAVTGPVIDRFGLGEPLSCSVLYGIDATLANTHTLSLAYKIQTGSLANGSDMADYAAVASVVVVTGNAGGTAQQTVVKQDVDLGGAKEYIRVVYTPQASATSVDTYKVAPGIVLGGMAELPQPVASTDQ